MRCVAALIACLVAACSAQAGTSDTINTVPNVGVPNLQTFLKNEDADRFGEQFASFVVSGCLGATAVGLSHTPTSCVAYPGGYRVTESGAITYPNNDLCWTIVHKDTTGNLSSDVTWTRVSGTHYLINCTASTLPTLPDQATWLMQVTTSGGSITAVKDLRRLTPVQRTDGPVKDRGGQVFDITASPYKAVCDGTTDDQAAIQTAENDADDVQGTVFIPPTTSGCKIASALVLSDGVTLAGAGPQSQLILPTGAAFDYVTATSVADVTIRDLQIVGGGNVSGIQAGIKFDGCTNCKVLDSIIYDADSLGIQVLDSVGGRIEGNFLTQDATRYAAATNVMTGIDLDGSTGVTVANNRLVMMNQGILLMGPVEGASESALADDACHGNTVEGNTVSQHQNHAFTLLSCDANTVTGNTAEKYEGVSTHTSFQSKSGAASPDDYSRANTFTGNTATECASGFGTNDSAAAIFAGNTARNCLYHGAFINGTPDVIVDGLIIDGYNTDNSGRSAVQIEASSHGVYSNIIAIPATAGSSTAVGVAFGNAAASNTVSNFTLHGTADIGLSVCSTCGNNIIGSGFRLSSATLTTPIDDDVQTTTYPCSYGIEMNAADTGNHVIGRPQRGMTVARITLTTVSTVGGGGNVVMSCGQTSSPTRFLNGVAMSTVARTVAIYDYNSGTAIANEGNLVAPNYIECSIAHTGTVSSGRVQVQVDGICAIHPA